MTARRIPASLTHDLRHRILRPNQLPDQLARPGDDDPMTGHYGSYEGERLVATAGEAGGPKRAEARRSRDRDA